MSEKDLKQNVSAVLQEALSGLDARGDATRFRDDNGFVRWGMVEQEIHKFIDEANDQISGGTPSSESDCHAGDCTTCGGPVFHREAKPGEYDHECRKYNKENTSKT